MSRRLYSSALSFIGRTRAFQARKECSSHSRATIFAAEVNRGNTLGLVRVRLPPHSFADFVYWQYETLPRFKCEFDSRNPLQVLRNGTVRRKPLTKTPSLWESCTEILKKFCAADGMADMRDSKPRALIRRPSSSLGWRTNFVLLIQWQNSRLLPGGCRFDPYTAHQVCRQPYGCWPA
jgi:hypothetical protein